MASQCVSGGCTKDGKRCQTCGWPLPPSRGVKPRKYCSKACAKGYLPKPAVTACRVCGCEIKQDRHGRTKTLCSKKCRNIAGKTPKQHVCKKCGDTFLSPRAKKDFCSDSCRFGVRLSDSVPCKMCGEGFVRARHDQKLCSPPCREKAKLAALKAARDSSEKRAKKYNCLNCGINFKRRRYKSGACSCQKKYCSRECAFEARRLKKSCAARPLEVAGQLASWFVSWGDDDWPRVYPCVECGAECRQRKAASIARPLCRRCDRNHPKPMPCEMCGIEIDGRGRRKRCRECSRAVLKDQRRANRKKRRRKHGAACNFRQRCKKYGAPYTSVSRKAVMDRNRWKCQLCGEKLLDRYTTIMGTKTPHPRSPTIDHIVPLSFGPTSPGHVFDNCQAACFECNSHRGVKPIDSFVSAMRRD